MNTNRVLAFVLLLSVATCSVGQRPAPQPKVLVLPIHGVGAEKSEILRSSLLARAALLGSLHERGFWVVPRVQLDAIAISRQIDLNSKESWSPETLRTISEPFKVRYVMGGSIARAGVSTDGAEPPNLTGEAQFLGWIYDLEKSDYVFKDREGTSKVDYSDLAKPEQTSAGVFYRVIKSAVGIVFQDFLERFPKPKPKKG